MTVKSISTAFCAIAIMMASLFCGCANYKLGTTLPPHLKTISVETFKNESSEPQIETTVTSEVIKQFQFDGQLKIADVDEADIKLVGKIVKYELHPVLFDRNSPKRANEYKAIVTVQIIATERATGKKITSDTITGSKTFDASGDLVTARRSVLPAVAKDLAKKVVDAVVSAW